ncbi:Predicted flavoprotein CzcO associated with the cation diffusion facilitator CzcD [Sphingopyxis indica]|uniref:Predicted flavoprotein CzcO associated with the cation diffusion facilitator CzcD n=2 Tax=Sphingopyxis indica TaxID=436663 RepID=A0A239I894_9SPHN|nr:Predicted flavoprotein CzcO associated with the cation diffusion facilitator CzcD [Sphingopyxis indica]
MPDSRADNAADSSDIAAGWVERFNRALASGEEAQLANVFLPEGYWRNVAGLERGIRTISGAPRIARELSAAARRSGTRAVRLDTQLAPPMPGEFAGRRTIDAWLRFDTAVSTGVGQVRLDIAEGPEAPRAWTLMTAIDELKGHDIETERRKRDGTAFERDWKRPNWTEQRKSSAAFADREPRVLIVGAGHGGLTVAAWLNALNVDNLVVDRHARIGDSWRKRYNSLKLHSPTASVHFPFLSYPPTWPKYIPKDKIANWMEFYADAMEINFWPETEFVSATYDRPSLSWEAHLKTGISAERVVRPAHIILATSQIGAPYIPDIPGIANFKGPVIHSSQFSGGAAWAGKRVLVMGTGTSAHDIAQELHAHGAQVTMVQRGTTEVIKIEPSAHVYLDALYELDGPSLALKDLIACSAPIEIVKAEHRRLTKLVRANDSDLLDRLEQAGFKVERDPESGGWPMKYFTRGGGYYMNVGCSDLIADGEISIVQFDQIESFETGGPVLLGGRRIRVDLVVLATGYKGYDDALPRWFGDDIAERVGQVWGIDPETGELRNMWTPTAQPGLWFAGGSFVHSRIYAKYVALQIKAEEEKLCPAS